MTNLYEAGDVNTVDGGNQVDINAVDGSDVDEVDEVELAASDVLWAWLEAACVGVTL